MAYLATLPLTKISILLFYLRIFPKKQMKIAIWALIGFNIAYLIVFEVISIFQCTPIPGGKQITYWPTSPKISTSDIDFDTQLGWSGMAHILQHAEISIYKDGYVVLCYLSKYIMFE